MSLRSAEILFKNAVAGVLTEENSGKTRFVYSPTWNEEIACCFPIKRREYEWPGLHPFFQHLGPEGWLRERQARFSHIPEEDDLGLLLRYGADCIGAVGIRLLGDTEWNHEATESISNPSRTVSGVQKKLLVIKDLNQFCPAPAHGQAPYIAKFNSASIPTLVRNELLSLRWISSVLGKNEVTQFDWGKVQEFDEVALIVERFDRTPDGTKLRLEDCSQILCKPRGVDYSGKYNASYEDIAHILMQYSSRPLIDLARFYRRLIVYILIGNCDAHLKNFSLLETTTGLRLSPAYDVLNTAIYPEYEQRLALSIGGQKRYLDAINRDMMIVFGQEIGLTSKAIEQIMIDLERQIAKAGSIITPPPVEDPDGFMTRFEEIVRNTCTRILKK